MKVKLSVWVYENDTGALQSISTLDFTIDFLSNTTTLAPTSAVATNWITYTTQISEVFTTWITQTKSTDEFATLAIFKGFIGKVLMKRRKR